MKRLTRLQKLSAIFGTGLLIAAASGSAFAMHTADDGDQPNNAVRHMKTSTAQTPATQAPTGEPGDEMEFRGTVEVMGDLWVVGGRSVAVTAATEIKAGLSIGTPAKVHAIRQTAGALWAREIEPVRESGPAEHHDQDNGNSNDNSQDDQGNGNGSIGSNDDNSNDDKGNINTNDDNGNDDTHHDADNSVNANDDHGHGDRPGHEKGNDDGNSNRDSGGQGHDNGHEV